MPAPPACDLSSWRAATANNSSPRRVIVVDAWPHVGIGHSIRAAALWLRLVSAVTTNAARSLRFANCVPTTLQSVFSESFHEVPACNHQLPDPVTRRNVSAVPYNVFRDLSFAGLELRARRSDFERFLRRYREGLDGWHPPKIRDCADLWNRLHSPRPRVLVLYGLRLRETLQACVESTLPSAGPAAGGGGDIAASSTAKAQPFACLPLIHLTTRAARPVPPCEVGLHLRSMRLDDRKCDLLLRSPPPPPPPPPLPGSAVAIGAPSSDDDPHDCRFAWRHRRCPSETLDRVIDGCPREARRFATADAPYLYAGYTRPRGWRDIGEHASVTWNERAITPYPVQLGDVRATAAAFVALARCTRAIIAPVASHFSETASLAAGVPLYGCCSEMSESLRKASV